MKVEELRIGNIIKTLQGVGRVEQIRHTGKHGYGVILEGVYGGSYIEYCEGVPLTEEVLLRCGFSKEGYKPGHIGIDFKNGHMTFDFTLNDPGKQGEWNKCYTFDLPDFRFLDIEYLHELQNLFFVVSGRELEYNVVDVTSSNYDKQMLIEMVREEAKTLSIVLDVDLNSRRRQSEILDKRHVIIWKLFKHHNSYTRIGKALGFSHVSVRNAVLKVEDLLSVNDANMVKLTNIISDL